MNSRCSIAVFLVTMLPGVVVSPAGLAAPACAQPAPLYRTADSSPPGLSVKLRQGVKDPAASAATLARKRNFRVTARLPSGAFLIADITPNTVDALRCDPQVEWVKQNVVPIVF